MKKQKEKKIKLLRLGKKLIICRWSEGPGWEYVLIAKLPLRMTDPLTRVFMAALPLTGEKL